VVSGPRFSILLPTHYRPDVIGCAIASVLAQTEPDFELLVVGDGAVAGTAEAVLGFKDPRIRWFDLPKGPGFGYANRNTAMEDARGRLVAHMSDDDIMLPDHLELMRHALERPGIRWAYSRVLWVSSDGIAAPDLTNLDIPDERRIFLEHYNSISGTVLAYRRQAFDTPRPWPEEVPEAADWEMMKRLLHSHGPSAMGRITRPTLLHFAASRKGVRHSHFDALHAWLGLADNAGWWPAELRATPGATPQAWYLDQLQRDPDYVRRLRQASEDIIARAALERLLPRYMAQTENQQIGQLQSSLAFSEAARAKSRVEAEMLASKLKALRESHSWRVTAPLRALKTRLTPRKP
jgi:glycosyltransferase involved in cell wall biosynthesis